MRSTILAVTAATLLATGGNAFKHTSPLLIWSSEPNDGLRETASEVSSGLIDAEEVYGTVHSLGCDWETLMVVHVDQLHNSHLASRSLPYSGQADLSIPYLLRPTRQSLDGALDTWAKVCGAEIVDEQSASNGGKQIVVLDASNDDDLSAIQIPSAPHLLLLTGTHSSVEKRQERPFPEHSSTLSQSSSTTTSTATSTAVPSSGRGRHNSTIPTGGPLLDRVQILTTPIITGVLISFLIFLPIIGFGIWALAGIQVPPRMMEIGKGMVVGKEKKDQ